ncbi:MAG: glycosyltransferase [Treponema sp.]
MKILLVNFADSGGGAAMAAIRLVTALNEHGVYARLGVSEKKSANPYVITLPKKKHCFAVKAVRRISSFAGRFFQAITKRLLRPFAFRSTNAILHTTNFHSETDINWINSSDFDIVNLHWISGVICNKDIAKIKKPVVWTMHDSWACCGAEHHPNIAENDTRWKEGYYRHNKPKSTKGTDICRRVWNQKKKYLGAMNIVFTAPSRWERDILKSSALFGHCKCEVIPNIVDHSVFYPRDKQAVRNLFDIPKDKIVLGFGAAYDIDNPKSMKGSYYLLEALNKLQNPENYFLVIFGPASDSFTSRICIPFFASGYISNPNILACLYSVCDCFINPSLIENLPTTSLESICCGVSVVAFDVGGTSDIVVHKETGFLAVPYKTEELAEGIEWCVQNQKSLSKNCLKKSRQDFDTDMITNKYFDVYEKLLNE